MLDMIITKDNYDQSALPFLLTTVEIGVHVLTRMYNLTNMYSHISYLSRYTYLDCLLGMWDTVALP